MPFKSSVSIPWRLKKSRYNLVGNRCEDCDIVHFPPRAFCLKCRKRDNMVEHMLSGSGVVESFTVIRTPPQGFVAPYVIALVRLDEGPLITSQIACDIEEIAIGKKVGVVFRKLSEDNDSGIIHYGFKFDVVD